MVKRLYLEFIKWREVNNTFKGDVSLCHIISIGCERTLVIANLSRLFWNGKLCNAQRRNGNTASDNDPWSSCNADSESHTSGNRENPQSRQSLHQTLSRSPPNYEIQTQCDAYTSWIHKYIRILIEQSGSSTDSLTANPRRGLEGPSALEIKKSP